MGILSLPLSCAGIAEPFFALWMKALIAAMDYYYCIKCQYVRIILSSVVLYWRIKNKRRRTE